MEKQINLEYMDRSGTWIADHILSIPRLFLRIYV